MLKKSIYSIFFNKLQIFKHAHPVFCTIAFIKVFHAGAGVGGTIVTKTGIGFFALFTDNDRASPARLGFGLIITVTAFAAILLSDMPDA